MISVLQAVSQTELLSTQRRPDVRPILCRTLKHQTYTRVILKHGFIFLSASVSDVSMARTSMLLAFFLRETDHSQESPSRLSSVDVFQLCAFTFIRSVRSPFRNRSRRRNLHSHHRILRSHRQIRHSRHRSLRSHGRNRRNHQNHLRPPL